MSINANDLTLTTVATAPSPATTGTSLAVATGTGSWYPTTFPFYVTVWNPVSNPNISNAEKSTNQNNI